MYRAPLELSNNVDRRAFQPYYNMNKEVVGEKNNVYTCLNFSLEQHLQGFPKLKVKAKKFVFYWFSVRVFSHIFQFLKYFWLN